jgi:8-oxo-dGTP diphosphatase
MGVRVAIAVVEQGGCFLVGRRPEGVPLAGLWEFPGGKILDGETAEAAAVRECLEETGIVVKDVLHLSSVGHEYEHGTVALEFIACRPVGPKQATPAPAFKWVPRGDLGNYEFPAANAAVLEMLVRQADSLGGSPAPAAPG